MAAIPPPNDNGSVVVRVPVPMTVGQPAPPPKPRPSATFILPGGVTPDVPKKLARVVDTSHFAEPLDKLYYKHWDENRNNLWSKTGRDRPDATYEKTQETYYSDPHHEILADYLADHDDPREDIVRGWMRHGKAVDKAFEKAGGERSPGAWTANWFKQPRHTSYPNPFSRQNPHPEIRLSDGTQLYFQKYSRGPNATSPAWLVHWSGPTDRWYTTVMGHQQFKNWLRRFDKDELSRIVKGMRNGR